MRKSIFTGLLLILAFGCGQSYNSNSGDISQYEPISGIDSSTPAGERLLASYKVMRSKCFSCHQGYSDFKTSEQWVSANLVTAGSLSQSLIYTKLKNVGGNMPMDPVAQLTPEELITIENWITGM